AIADARPQLALADAVREMQKQVRADDAGLVAPGLHGRDLVDSGPIGRLRQEHDQQAARIGVRARVRLYGVGALFTPDDADRYLAPAPPREFRLDRCRELELVEFRGTAGEHDVAAVDVRRGVGVTEPFEQRSQVGHRDLVAPADIDASKQCDVSGHRAPPVQSPASRCSSKASARHTLPNCSTCRLSSTPWARESGSSTPVTNTVASGNSRSNSAMNGMEPPMPNCTGA